MNLGCYAQPGEDVFNATYPLSSTDRIKECRNKCQPMRSNATNDKEKSLYPANFFVLSSDQGECRCLPNHPLGGSYSNT